MPGKILPLLKLWIPPILWAIVIYLFSSMSFPPSSRVYWQDFLIKKSAHIIEYGILAVLLYQALRGSGVERTKSIVLSVVIAVVYGATDEFHQGFTPGRQPKVRDIFFDTAGSILGTYLVDKKTKIGEYH